MRKYEGMTFELGPNYDDFVHVYVDDIDGKPTLCIQPLRKGLISISPSPDKWPHLTSPKDRGDE